MLPAYKKTMTVMTIMLAVAVVAGRLVSMFSADPAVSMYAYVLPWLVGVVVMLFIIGADEDIRLTVGKVIIVTLVGMLVLTAVVGVLLYLLVPAASVVWAFRIGWFVTLVAVAVEAQLVNPENVAAAQQAAERRAEANLEKKLTMQREAQQAARERVARREIKKRNKRK
ncbi:hypothetical protein GFD17_06440 [Bifidobacterium sp. SMB2]|uniref:Uncharacterized protein n=1 Tax=Bifidobacterium saimiriisciurei TaxID=2661627 RepID=A0ABX0C748_9BIFI|nr:MULTISPECIES: hypothetical protein [Bifidobacterium]NEG96395.1 hypothetical protein [Bifidobacterium sp. SMB2]NEH10973.1 hypothetical protein [Bifidobacterium saimiriisciurei]